VYNNNIMISLGWVLFHWNTCMH